MTQDQSAQSARALVLDHIAAFNAHSTERLLAGLATDAVWQTGQDTVRGHAGLGDLFDDWLWSRTPALDVHTLLVEGTRVAAELREQLIVDGQRQTFDIAVFFDTDADRITSVKVYREGRADLD
jgi:hypothetical protein